jgi:hypothetical protein
VAKLGSISVKGLESGAETVNSFSGKGLTSQGWIRVETVNSLSGKDLTIETVNSFSGNSLKSAEGIELGTAGSLPSKGKVWQLHLTCFVRKQIWVGK